MTDIEKRRARTEKARRANERKGDEKHAERMRARGWMCFPPEVVRDTRAMALISEALSGRA